jgi:hypothetical protein
MCSVYDRGGHVVQNSITISVYPVTINSLTITSPEGDSSGNVYYDTNAASMLIGFTIDLKASPLWDPQDPNNWVALWVNYNGYNVPYCISSSSGDNYYCINLNLASGYPNSGTSAHYTVYAAASTATRTQIYSSTINLYVEYTKSSGGGGGGGCPYFQVYNGSEYIDEGLLDIHTGYNGTDLVRSHTLLTTPAIVDGTYVFRLTENWETISNINQVKLYATLSNGMTMELPLLSAVETQIGNVWRQLAFDDNLRAVELGAKWNNGTSQSIDLRFLALPPWIHVVSFTFVIIGYNKIVKD